MKLLSIKLLALAYTATTTTAIANDDNKTNNNLLLRGSSSTPLLIANKWDDGMPPVDEEKEEVYDEEEERHPLGCMCMNSRMMPQRGQCCGKCDEGMCPASDVRCQGCNAAESGDSEEGACESDPSLSPFSRKYSMRSPSQVCEEESSATGSNFTVPYKCRGQQRGGLQYACCEAGLGNEMTSLGGKKCTKEEDDSDNNTRSSSSGGQCTPDGSLNPRSRAQRGISATSICQRKDGFPVPYSCSGHGGPMQGGYACCTSDSDDEVTDPGHGLGKCTKLPKMPNGLPPQNDEEEVLNFVHIGSNSCEEDTSLDGLDSHSKQAMNKMCQQNHAEDGYTVPYTCNGTAGETTLYACCMPGVGMDVIWESDSSGLGLCTKVEEKEEKEVLVAYE